MDEDEWEMKYCDLQIQGHLGSGQFGDVSLAFLTNPACTTRVKSYFDRMCTQGDSLSLSCAVAVKSVKGTMNSDGYLPMDMHVCSIFSPYKMFTCFSIY